MNCSPSWLKAPLTSQPHDRVKQANTGRSMFAAIKRSRIVGFDVLGQVAEHGSWRVRAR
jgi:hypothetical protein